MQIKFKFNAAKESKKKSAAEKLHGILTGTREKKEKACVCKKKSVFFWRKIYSRIRCLTDDTVLQKATNEIRKETRICSGNIHNMRHETRHQNGGKPKPRKKIRNNTNNIYTCVAVVHCDFVVEFFLFVVRPNFFSFFASCTLEYIYRM